METRRLGAAPTALLHHLARCGPQSMGTVEVALSLNHRQAVNAFCRLVIRGYASDGNGIVRLTEAGVDAAVRGEVTTGGPKGRVKAVRNTLRERAWRAMRVRRRFTIGEIVADAATGAEPAARDNVTRFLARLRQAGYVTELARRLPGTVVGSNGFKRYHLIRDTGPLAPAFREGASAIHDRNTGEDVPCVPR